MVHWPLCHYYPLDPCMVYSYTAIGLCAIIHRESCLVPSYSWWTMHGFHRPMRSKKNQIAGSVIGKSHVTSIEGALTQCSSNWFQLLEDCPRSKPSRNMNNLLGTMMDDHENLFEWIIPFHGLGWTNLVKPSHQHEPQENRTIEHHDYRWIRLLNDRISNGSLPKLHGSRIQHRN